MTPSKRMPQVPWLSRALVAPRDADALVARGRRGPSRCFFVPSLLHGVSRSTLHALRQRVDDAEHPALAARHAPRPRRDRALPDRELRVGDDELRVDLDARAEAVARAGTCRAGC